MAKYLPKSINNQYNQITSIQHQDKVKRPKNIQQQSSEKTETTKVNAVIEQLDELIGNGHGSKTNINHFSPLFESYDEEGTKHRNKTKTPIVVLSYNEERMVNEGFQNKGNKEDEDDLEKKITTKMYDPDRIINTTKEQASNTKIK